MKSSRKLGKLITDADGELAILITRTRQLSRWTRLLRAQLEDQLAVHCYIGGLEETLLTIVVDNAAWATRLRFQSAQLLSRLVDAHPVFAKLRQIKVKVLNADPAKEVQAPVPTGPRLSQDNANIINMLSDAIDDPDLQAALQRLTRHVDSD